MAVTYSELKKKYEYFRYPAMEVEVDGNRISDDKKTRMAISDVTIDLSAGFEASQAVFTIYNVFDQMATSFDSKSVKKYILLGSVIKIYLGYNKSGPLVFAGVITKINFFYEKGEIPGIQVTAMDVKAVMMANSCSKQLTAKTYGDAVKEIFDQTIYQNLKGDGAITDFTIGSTPDGGAAGALTGAVGGGAAAGAAGDVANATDKTIEMVAESDYEFVVKVAKKYNFDFFVHAGQVVFRTAKSDSSTLMEITNEASIQYLNVEYDITSQVGLVEVRGLDAGKAKVLTGKAKNTNKLSQGNKAKSLVSNSTYVYLDPSATSTEEAQYRAKYLQEERTYRLATLELTMIGIPELVPGRFIKLDGFGTGVDNSYYIQALRHTLDSEGHFQTKIIGKAASVASALPGLDSVPGVSKLPI
ncbi:MAG: phage late control D family protein [Lachnospiraceae bacterium]|nr:phage late control D family protein [Lachnospiraceae bacterium]